MSIEEIWSRSDYASETYFPLGEFQRLAGEVLAELSKNAEPIAVVEEVGRCVDGTQIFNGVGAVSVGQKLYTHPQPVEAIKQRVAEACAAWYKEEGWLLDEEDVPGALVSGKWREFVNNDSAGKEVK